MRASGSPFQSYKSKRILSFAKFICSSVTQLKPPALKNDVSSFCHNQLQWKVMGHFWNSIRKMWSVCTKIALMEKYFKRKHSQTPVCCLCANLPTVNLVPRASFPLTSGRKTRALGASISGMRHRYHRRRLRTAQWNRTCRIALIAVEPAV